MCFFFKLRYKCILNWVDDEQLYENRLMSPKTKTQLTICAYGSLEDSYIIRKYETIVGGKAVFDTWNHILRIIGKSAFGDEQIIYDVPFKFWQIHKIIIEVYYFAAKTYVEHT